MTLPPQVSVPELPKQYAWRASYIGGQALAAGVLFASMEHHELNVTPATEEALVDGLAGLLGDISKIPAKHQAAVCGYALERFKRGVSDYECSVPLWRALPVNHK